MKMMKKAVFFGVGLLLMAESRPCAADEFTNSVGLASIGADTAYTTLTEHEIIPGKGATIAVIDTGARLTHQEFANQLSEHQADSYDDKSFSAKDGDHGTEVAGIIAAAKDDVEMHGVAYGAKRLNIATKIADSDDEEECENCLTTEQALAAMTDVKYADVQIINNSWGPTEPLFVSDVETLKDMSEKYPGVASYLEERLYPIVTALAEQNKLLVVSAGNEMGAGPLIYLAGLPRYYPELHNIISVVAYDSSKATDDPLFLSSFSNRAKNAEKWSIAAPGTGIYSTTSEADNTYKTDNGTSMAAPFVSGAAAVVSSAFPFLNGKQIGDVLLSTAKVPENLPLAYYQYDVQYDTQHPEKAVRVTVNIIPVKPISTDEQKEAWTTYATSVYESHSCEAGCTKILQVNNGEDIWNNGDPQYATTYKEVDLSEVFGVGLLDLATAVKGPKTLDANRLSSGDFFGNEYLYTVDVPSKLEGLAFSNPIAQKKKLKEDGTTYEDYNVGLRKTGSGKLVLSGVNTYLGTTSVEGGTLGINGTDLVHAKLSGPLKILYKGVVTAQYATLADATIYGMATLDTVDMKNLVTGQGGTATIVNTVNTEGTITNGGKLIVTGHLNYAGTDPVTTFLRSTGTLQFQNGGTITGGVQNEGVVSVTENGTVDTIVNKGNVAVSSGKTLTAVVNNAGGNISGEDVTAKITTLNNTAGVLTSPMYIETLNNDGGTLLIKSAQNDIPLIVKGNTVNLSSGKILFAVTDTVPFNNPAGGTYTIVSADTSLTRDAAFVVDEINMPYISFLSSVDGKDFNVNVTFKKIAESSPNMNTNEQKLISVYDNFFFNQNNRNVAGLYYTSAKELKYTLDQFLEATAPVSARDLPLADAMGQDVYARLLNIRTNVDTSTNLRGRSGGINDPSHKIWGQAIGAWGRRDGNQEAGNRKIRTQAYGLMFGGDVEVSDSFLVGLTAGYAYTKIDQAGNTLNIDDYRGGVYFDGLWSSLSVQGMALAGYQKYDSNKYFSLPGYAGGKTTGSFNGYSAEGGVNIGYMLFANKPRGMTRQYYGSSATKPFGAPYITVRPYVGANASFFNQESYNETGDPLFALHVAESSETSVSAKAGVTVSFSQPEFDYFIDASYQRLLTGNNPETEAYLLSDGAKTVFKSLKTEKTKDYFGLGIGCSTHLYGGWSLDLQANGQWSTESVSGTLSATVLYQW